MCTAATAWEEEGARQAAGRCRVPRSYQMRASDTRADGERDVKVLPGRRTVGGGGERRASGQRAELHVSVGSWRALCRWPAQPPRVLGDKKETWDHPGSPTRAPWTCWG